MTHVLFEEPSHEPAFSNHICGIVISYVILAYVHICTVHTYINIPCTIYSYIIAISSYVSSALSSFGETYSVAGLAPPTSRLERAEIALRHALHLDLQWL